MINNSNNPLLLPNKDPFIRLLIEHVHKKILHSGVRDTLITLREQYRILKGRQEVRRVVHSCVLCKKVEGVPYSVTCSPDLPKFRVSEDPPFTHTGLDFAGLLFIYDDNLTESNELQKVYVCLFTCASTRGIHLELTNSLDVTSFLLALCRFSA